MSFASDMEAYAKKAGASLEETTRAVALELFGSVIKDTPVQTGRAKGNWQTTIGVPASGEVDRLGDQAALSELGAVAGKFGAGQTIYLTNNLPYIGKLEYGGYGTGPGATEKTNGTGFSVQAPAGMVRKNVARIQSIVSKAARDNKI